MIVDTSALIALLRDQPDAPHFAAALATRRQPKRLSAANYLETAIVIDGSRDPVASRASRRHYREGQHHRSKP